MKAEQSQVRVVVVGGRALFSSAALRSAELDSELPQSVQGGALDTLQQLLRGPDDDDKAQGHLLDEGPAHQAAGSAAALIAQSRTKGRSLAALERRCGLTLGGRGQGRFRHRWRMCSLFYSSTRSRPSARTHAARARRKDDVEQYRRR